MKRAEIQELWQKRLEDYHASGMKSRRAWCRMQGLNHSNLCYWEKKQCLQGDLPAATEQMQWMSVAVEDGVYADSSLAATPNNVVVKVGKATIEVTPGFNKDLFTTVIRMLVELC